MMYFSDRFEITREQELILQASHKAITENIDEQRRQFWEQREIADRGERE